MISSMAASAEPRSVTAISCGQRSSSGVACARGEPTKTAPSPPVGQAAQAVGDAPVQVADGRELLPARQQLAGVDRLPRRRYRHEPLGVLALHPLRPLQVEEMPQRLLAERQQVEL